MKLRRSSVTRGCRFWFYENDRTIGQRIAIDKYDPYLTKLFLDSINPGDTVLDIGANIGYDSVLFAKTAKTVYAFEPDSQNFKLLQKNIAENNIKNIVAEQKAVGQCKGTVSIFRSKNNYGDQRVYSSKNQNVVSEQAEVVNLDNYLKLLKIAMIKIDVQGYEPAVISGAYKIISRDKPILFWEYWPWGYKAAGLDYRKMVADLLKLYGAIYYIDEYIQIYYPVDQRWLDKRFSELDNQAQCNLVVLPSQNIWRQYKDFWLKKWIKRKLGRPAT